MVCHWARQHNSVPFYRRVPHAGSCSLEIEAMERLRPLDGVPGVSQGLAFAIIRSHLLHLLAFLKEKDWEEVSFRPGVPLQEGVEGGEGRNHSPRERRELGGR